MGVSWQTPDQKAFLENSFSSYAQHSASGTLKTTFWPSFFTKWFEQWPLPDPSPNLVQKVGTKEKAAQLDRSRKISVSTFNISTEYVGSDSLSIQQIKRVFKGAADDGATGGRRNLRLEDRPPRKRSEVQVYMALYYNDRIRSDVVKRWTETGVNMNFSRSEIPDDEIDPEDSSLLKDTQIPICFKNQVAQELYDAEDEDIKYEVRLRRETEVSIKTVYTAANEEERMKLVREYWRSATDFTQETLN